MPVTEESLRFKLTIAYDGTNYEGWQVQKIGLGVQQKIEESFAKIFPGVKRIHSSSRTDTGVHARAMMAHVDIPQGQFRMEERKLALALNSYLPTDIRIMAATRCKSTFHARFDATGKEYRYFVWNHHALDPLVRHQAWLFPKELDLARMKRAASLVVGTHDFASFAATRAYAMKSTVRTVTQCGIQKKGHMITFTIRGDGFLYKMCRGIAGTLVQVGAGKIEPETMSDILAKKDRRVAGMTAPAHGLVLWKVFYGKKSERTDVQAGEEEE